MKRLRSSEDLASFGEKGVCKDWGRREEESSSHRSLMNRNSYYKSESARKGLSSSSSRYDRVEDDRDSSRSVRKRSDYDVDNYERRKSYDRYREGNSERGISSSSPRSGYGADRIHRSESLSGLRREVPKGFRSERDRSRREGSVSSWRRFGQGKDGDEGIRGYNDSGKVSRVESDDAGKAKSPQILKDPKSPPWSKDSGSEQSKSVEVKRNEELPVESSGNNSEMEEGELEPDPQPLSQTDNTAEDQASDRFQSSRMELEGEHLMQQEVMEERSKSMSAENMESRKVSQQDERVEGGFSENIHVSSKEVNELTDCENVSRLTNGSGDENETVADEGGGKEEKVSSAVIACKEEVSESQTLKERVRELKTDETDLPERNKSLSEGTGECMAVSAPVMEEICENIKDKGKTVALSASNCTPLTDQFKSATEMRGPVTNRDTYLDGPSTKSLDLFTTDPVRKHEKELQLSNNKPKDERLTLDLSLSLPNVLLPIDARKSVQAPGSPSHGRSIQSFHSSFHTDSEFTASMSFSGSQLFTHNPSCSLTHEAFDNEQSVKSRPLFQGVDWQALASDETRHKDLPPIVQKLLADGNGLQQQYQTSQGNTSSRTMAEQNRAVEGSFRTTVELERQLSFSKQYSGVLSQLPNEIRSLSQGVGSHELGLGYLREKKEQVRDKEGGRLCKSGNHDGREQQLNVGADFVESIMNMIVSEPVNVVARRFSDMSRQQIAFLKDSVRDVIRNPSRQRNLISFQKALQRRSNITLEMLLKLRQTHLEILVALKTGLEEYIESNVDITTSILAEIFLNLRCRNPSCKSLLPVDECDCKICSQRSGFCRECMCLVCSKFDMAANTCSWVGCDVCLHWCHADCGLRESYIRNGRSATGPDATTEMQFHCVACDHPSEMFGFVKEVFLNFAKEWNAEILSKELEHVRSIFCASEDLRGKQLHKITILLLSKLENKVNLQEVQKHIMGFLTDSDSLKHFSTSTMPRKELSLRNDQKTKGIAGCSQEVQWPKSVNFDRAPQLDKPTGLFPSLDGSRNTRENQKIDLQMSIPKEHGFDELESIVRIKHVESKMFQGRADDARREAEALKRIAATKNERIEEEYASRIAKLRLADAEEIRKQKLEELQAVESVYQDYFRLKMRMETDIKDLLLKMDATRRNLSL